MSDAVLTTSKLRVCYGDTIAVHGIDLSVEPGAVLGLIGPDGAGKTSILRVLAGLQPATSGAAQVFGATIWNNRRALHHRLGYLAQRFALYGDLSVNENIRFFGTAFGVPKFRQRRDELLDKVGLAEFGRRRADQLSGGMKQKLALACTLIHEPEILLLDEPTTGVDPVTRREFWRLLADLVSEGLTLVIATPYLDEAERCTEVVLLHRGQVLARDQPASLPHIVPGQVLEILTQERQKVRSLLCDLPAVSEVDVFGPGLHARLVEQPDPVRTVQDYLAQQGIDDLSIRPVESGLEDAFLYLTRQAKEAS